MTRAIPDVGLDILDAAGLDVEVYSGELAPDRATLLERVRGCVGLLTLVTDRVDAELLDAAGPQLRVVANYAVGYDNIDVDACTARNVAVTNTPDVLTEATADHAFALLLAVARRVLEGDALVREDRWRGWGPKQLLGRDIGGQTLGIVGLGRIGTAVARRARGFGMTVLYHNRSRDDEAEARLGVRYAPDLHDLLARSDAISIHVPLSEQTRHLIGAEALKAMPPHAILVNTARGPIVDEKALVRGLEHHHLWGAGLDVFEREPEVEAGLRRLPNVVLAPHTGSATHGARNAMADLAATSIVQVLRGERPSNILNPTSV
ncbi:MAG: D-glycerate dehydrogenase [Trueperaceae bacterium]|nr:D-glycerate dehydrogenase [Trueperaceae bacterium]